MPGNASIKVPFQGVKDTHQLLRRRVVIDLPPGDCFPTAPAGTMRLALPKLTVLPSRVLASASAPPPMELRCCVRSSRRPRCDSLYELNIDRTFACREPCSEARYKAGGGVAPH